MATAVHGEQGHRKAEHGCGEHPRRVLAPDAGAEIKREPRDTGADRSGNGDEQQQIHNREVYGYLNLSDIGLRLRWLSIGLRRRRRPAESRDRLRSAAVTFDSLGVTPWADRARAELAATGETIRRPDDGRDRLTPQELQIAQLAAQGLSNRHIAERLFISPRTVSTHLYRIYPKLEIGSRSELIRALPRHETPGG
ncbi:hypothetical protein Rhe02_17360 [Rhizocola hellebori]|uniref:HTH luxR-type domain-containing protein n=1 Tax=Rhizocola hellebori TaxID=1392758 RepID=A0A8J3VDL4_9ACTN|nr:helix-turn-helix transcriptional regulator [Rhizocola hellebori]GIH03669.1 hypothetical protein Rhe02_17360 [Rhizocola hellebori]